MFMFIFLKPHGGIQRVWIHIKITDYHRFQCKLDGKNKRERVRNENMQGDQGIQELKKIDSLVSCIYSYDFYIKKL